MSAYISNTKTPPEIPSDDSTRMTYYQLTRVGLKSQRPGPKPSKKPRVSDQAPPVGGAKGRLPTALEIPREALNLLAVRAREGDARARELVIRGCLRLAYTLSGNYAGRGIERDDLVCEAIVGLLEAISRYNLTSGGFVNYSHFWIIRQLERAVHDYAASIRVPVHTSRERYRLQAITLRFEQEHDRKPSEEELVQLSGYTQHKIHTLQMIPQVSASLDDLRPDCDAGINDGAMKRRRIDSTASPETEESSARHAAFLSDVRESVTMLSPIRQQIIDLRFGLTSGVELSRHDVAETLGIPQTRVARLEKDSLKTLKGVFEGASNTIL